jgi:hypothetical protein
VEQRVRSVSGGCPRCHGQLLVLERTTDEREDTDEAPHWRIVTARCAASCLLGFDDFP